MGKLESQLEEIKEQEKQIVEKIKRRDSNRTIECASCEESHRIRDLSAVQNHSYVGSLCNGGGYFKDSELCFVCPETGVLNRILLFDGDIPWEEREGSPNPESQFKSKYSGLFKSVEHNYEERISGEWVNNFYVDSNRKKFGLVEKRKSSL